MQWQHRFWAYSWKIARIALVVFVLLFVVLLSIIQFYVIPNVNRWRQDVALDLAQQIGRSVSLDDIKAGWHDLHLHLTLSGLQVKDPAGHSLLKLQTTNVDIAWSSFILFKPYLFNLSVDEPVIFIHRDNQGRLFVAGIRIMGQKSLKHGSFGDWLLHQRHLHVTHAQIVWKDDWRHVPPLTLNNVNLTINNFAFRHAFSLSVTPPVHLADPLSVSGVLYGHSLESPGSWHGRVSVDAPRLDLIRIKSYIDYPFDIQSAIVGGSFSFRLANRHLTSAHGQIDIRNLVARIKPRYAWLNINRLSSGFDFEWQRKQAFSLTLSRLFLVQPQSTLISKSPVLPASFYLSVLHDNSSVYQVVAKADHLNLEDISRIVKAFPLPKGIQGWLYDYQPKGQVNQLSLNLAGRLNNLRLVNLNVRFKDFGIDPVNHRPGFNHLSGSLIMQKDSGNVLIDSRNVAFVWPEQWQKPLFFDTAVGRLSWKREGHDWQIATNGIHLTNSGLIASVTGTYRTDLQSPGYLDLHGDIQQCNAKDIPSYLPRSIGEPVITWLKSAIQAGQVKNATVLIQGNLQDFPFRVSSQGRFMAQAHVTKGRLDYAPGWPSLNNLALDLRFNGTKMQIDGRSGNLYAGQLSNIKADIPDLFRPNPLLTVTGQAFAPTQDLLHFIWKSPINKMLSHIADGVVVRGNGRLNLTLFIPLGSAQPIHAAGTYQFINNEIQFPHHLPGLSSVNGVLNFTGTRAKASRLQAHMLGGPVSIDLDADTATGSKIRLTGLGQINQALKWLNVPFRNYLSGMTPYQAKLEVSPDGSRNLSVKSRLVGITSRLPYPFSKTSDESVPFFIDNRISPLNQGRKISAQYGRHLLKLAWMGNLDGKTVQAKISFQKKLGRLPVSGIEVTGSLDRLNADAWRTLIPWHHGKPVLAFPSLHVHLELGLLEVAHHGFHHVKLNLVPTHEIWVAQVSSDELAGTIHYDSKGSGAVQANLTRLSLPIPSEVLTGTDLYLPHQSQIKSQELPTFNIQARNLILNTHHYGMMHLQATPHGQDWVINSLTLENKDSKLYLKGKWDDMSNLSHSEANFTLDVHDIGHYLSRIGHPNLVRGGKAKLTGQLTWNGPLTHLDYPSLTGKLSLTADKGQFLKADPGIGKLLGILSLQALPGRFALDFHDIFSHGFAFDTIQSNLVVNKGVLQTDDFRMYGPSALVLMSGQTDLNHETQRINVHVIPNVGNSISVGAAFLGGPVVGLTSLLLQKLLKDPVGRIVSYHYLITGDWDKPLVKRVSAAKASQGSGVAN